MLFIRVFVDGGAKTSVLFIEELRYYGPAITKKRGAFSGDLWVPGGLGKGWVLWDGVGRSRVVRMWVIFGSWMGWGGLGRGGVGWRRAEQGGENLGDLWVLDGVGWVGAGWDGWSKENKCG